MSTDLGALTVRRPGVLFLLTADASGRMLVERRRKVE